MSLIKEAAHQTGHEVLCLPVSQQTREILNCALDEVDLAIVEIGTSVHSVAILEALSDSRCMPVIAIIDRDEVEMAPIVRRLGAAAYLTKPFDVDEIAMLITEVSGYARKSNALCCDKWGHLVSAAGH